IITGSAKGTTLYTLEGDATRPTSERAKEALFSMLQFDLEGRRVLDLFAGSGQLGLEALSRGAAFCQFVDASPAAADIVKKNAAKTRLQAASAVAVSDYAAFLRRPPQEGFDIVFLDPPYASDCLRGALERLRGSSFLRRGALLACESGTGEILQKYPELALGYTLVKSKHYGRIHYDILTPKEEN
ncbi:MAG: 16S rRNA (guanine(966)-N(2))-methyltransferase RsmD, partial [Clostridia bacterium]|nr:16S rRNA (guanine(966)-N(2))-methyltransferase RsmD [Clostridia bacterium]